MTSISNASLARITGGAADGAVPTPAECYATRRKEQDDLVAAGAHPEEHAPFEAVYKRFTSCLKRSTQQ